MRAPTAPVKAPRSWTEHLGFEQVRRDRAAVDGDERLVRPPAVRMDVAGDQLLASAALAHDQHRRIGGGDPLADAEDLFHHGVIPLDREVFHAAAPLQSLLGQTRVAKK
jgi:hypothetical protein